MPSPSSSLATQRPDIAQSFMEFDLQMDAMGFVANRVAPVANVAKKSGNFGKIPLKQLLQSGSTKRAPGGGYSRGNWTFEPSTYACEEHGWEEPIDDSEAEMYSDYFDAEQIAGLRAYSFVLRNAEQRVADAVFNATTFSSNTTALSNEWDDYANATPVADVEAAVQAVYAASGLWPNALVINRKVFRNLRLCAEIRDRIAASGAGFANRAADVTESQLAAVFDLDEIIVAGSSKNTANEGQDASVSQIWSDEYAMVCRVTTSQDFREPGLMRTFHWAEDGSEIGGHVETYRDETKRSDIVRVRHDVDEVMLYANAGHLLSNVTT